MHLRLTGYSVLVTRVSKGNDRCVPGGLAREGTPNILCSRTEVRFARVAKRAPQAMSRKSSYVAESSIVTDCTRSSQSCRDPLHVCVTKLPDPPSNLGSNFHLDFWRPDPGQLPMNSESCERETLPRMQKNNSSRLIAAVSAAPQRRAKNCPMRGPF